MKIGEDLICLCYMFFSSIGFFYQLGNQSVLTVQCENPKTFCLEHVSHRSSSLRYSFAARELEVRCNIEGISLWLRLLVFFGVFYEFVVYGGAVYVYYYKPKTLDVDFGVIFQRCVYVTASITGIFTCFYVLLPLAIYAAPNGGAGRRGYFAEMWASPARGLLVLIIGIMTAPLKLIFHNRFKTELGLNEIYTNYTCVEPSVENGLVKCPNEGNWFSDMQDPSICESDFYCTKECFVVFPTMVINSLGFILASLALFYRLLRLTHYIIKRERGFDSQKTEDGSSTTIIVKELAKYQDKNLIESASSGASGGDMKDKSVARSKPKAAGFKTGEKAVYPRRNAIGKREAVQERTGGTKTRLGAGDATLDSQRRDTHKSNEKASATTNTVDLSVEDVNLDRRKEIAKNSSELAQQNEAHLNCFRERTTAGSEHRLEEAKFDSFSEHNRLVNGRGNAVERTRGEKEENIASKTNTEFKKGSSKILSTSQKDSFSEETSPNKRNGKTGTGCRSQSNKTNNFKGKAKRTSPPNGHLRQERKVCHRAQNVENGLTEVKMGNPNGSEGYEEREGSSSEDIVDGIEGLLVVEDESEFYMSGFRL